MCMHVDAGFTSGVNPHISAENAAMVEQLQMSHYTVLKANLSTVHISLM